MFQIAIGRGVPLVVVDAVQDADGLIGAARERHIEAAEKDPDADPDEAAAQWDQEHGQTGTGAAAGTATADTSGDQSVEHYERTEEPGVERERRFERDEDGEGVRDEQYEQPRTDR